MSTFGMDELKSVIEADEDYCVSIYFPTYRGGVDVQKDRTRFKQLIENAKLLLIQKGWNATRADDFLSPFKPLHQDEVFWQHHTQGLAFFMNANLFHYYRLPFHVQEQVLVDRRFLIRPLLPILNNSHRFYILAISENSLRFLKGSIFDVEELHVKTLPKDVKEAIRFNDPERQLQSHSQTPRIPGARAAVIFHGQGVGIDDEKDDLQEYCRQVDRGLHPLLKNEKAPLIVAAVDALVSMYGKMNTYPHLTDASIPGNPELLSNKELRNRAWKIVESLRENQTKDLLDRHIDLANRVTNNVEDILSAAHQGRVQHLLVNSEQPWWGRYSEGRVEPHETPGPEDTEIVNLAMIETLKTGGKVHELKPPSPQYPSLLAIYRY